MATNTPTASLDRRFSTPQANALPWSHAEALLERAELYILTTLHGDGRPHATPLVAVWLNHALYFCTGRDEQKARNLAGDQRVLVTTGCNTFASGLDVVIEGKAARVTEQAQIERCAAAFQAKYDDPFRFEPGDGTLRNDEGGEAIVFVIRPETAFGFDKGETFGQTRWRFGR